MLKNEPPYGEAFYDANEGGSYRSASVILRLAFPILRPKSVLDVGCGVGTWLRAARENGAADVAGIDGTYINRQRFHVDPTCFTPADLTKPGALKAAIQGRCFDVTLCLETAEHLHASSARELVEALALSSDVILWGAALPGQGGTCHVNERPLTYWASLWHAAGFIPVDMLRPGLQFASIDVWYAQNSIIFARPGQAARITAAFVSFYNDYYGFVPPLSFIHPTAASAWQARPQEEVSRSIEGFGSGFLVELAQALGLAADDIERTDFAWEGRLAWIGLSPRDMTGLQPSLLLRSPHGTTLQIGLYFPIWQTGEDGGIAVKQRAEAGGLVWNSPTSFSLDGWVALTSANPDLRLTISLLEGQPDHTSVFEAAKDAAQLWRAYFHV